MRLRNDSQSFHPVYPLIRAFGPRHLHHAKGRGHCRRRLAEFGAQQLIESLAVGFGKKVHVELFNDRFRDEFLNTELFTTPQEAQILAERRHL